MAELGPKGLREFIARLVFNAAIGNGDMQQAIEDHMGSIPLLQSKFGSSLGRRPR